MPSEINETKYTKLFNNAVDYLDREAFQNDSLSETDLTQREISDRKIAMAIIGSYPRHRQAQASIANVTLSVLQGAAENEEDYRQLIRNHMPGFARLASGVELLDVTNKKAQDLQKRIEQQSANHVMELKSLHDEIEQLRGENMLLKDKIEQR